MPIVINKIVSVDFYSKQKFIYQLYYSKKPKSDIFVVKIDSRSFILEFHFDFSYDRRIHITKAVYEHIKNDFSIEDGECFKRDEYLKEQNVKSYFIVTQQEKGCEEVC